MTEVLDDVLAVACAIEALTPLSVLYSKPMNRAFTYALQGGKGRIMGEFLANNPFDVGVGKVWRVLGLPVIEVLSVKEPANENSLDLTTKDAMTWQTALVGLLTKNLGEQTLLSPLPV